jgi:hypothetical protein
MTKSTEPTNRQLAAQLRRDARAYAAPFRRDSDPEFRAQIAKDVADLMAVAELLQAGQLRAAQRRYWKLDTAVRDAASQAVWLVLSV